MIRRKGQLEIYRVDTHEYAATTPFKDVQKQIEQQIKKERKVAARKQELDKLMEMSTIVTMFDEQQPN